MAESLTHTADSTKLIMERLPVRWLIVGPVSILDLALKVGEDIFPNLVRKVYHNGGNDVDGRWRRWESGRVQSTFNLM